MSWLGDTWDSFKDTASDAWDEVTETAEDIKDAAEDLAGDVQDTWNDAFEGVTEALREGSFLEAVVAGFGGLAAGIVGTVGNVLDFAFDVVGAVVGGILGVAGAIVGGVVRTVITFVSGGLLSGLAKDIGRWIAQGLGTFGDWIQTGFDLLGNFVERIFDIAARFILAVTTRIRCTIRWIKRTVSDLLGFDGGEAPKRRGVGQIDHFFVLMLENRSFDHMLGQMTSKEVNGVLGGQHSNVTGAGQTVYAGGDAKFELGGDPPHEFAHVETQLHGGPTHPNGGFIQAFDDHMQEEYALPFIPEDAREVMRGFSPQRLPILHTLAREYAVCDAWFSSLPGPTLPNRLFALAGTSGGLADSPMTQYLTWAMTVGGFEFDAGSVFDALSGNCISWRIYAGDATPLVMTLKGIATEDTLNGWNTIRSMDELTEDLANAGSGFPRFSFIEPDYGHFWSDFKGGTSQHPLDSVKGGERLIKNVYESLVASPVWNRSALIITYDEHGGFYDHVVPPDAPVPGDSRPYESWAEDAAARQFGFNRFGVRVPAVVVSPYIPRGTVSHAVYDHTSIIATVSQRFHLRSLTDRSRKAERLDDLFSLGAPRSDVPRVLPGV